MSLLREYIRELLAEGMKTVVDLPDGFVVVIKSVGPGYYSVYYGKQDDQSRRVLNSVRAEGGPWGQVTFGKPMRRHGHCDGAMRVGNAAANPGWGPLLYDVAIEYATRVANGLISDRDSVSPDARNVWRYYMDNRSDVTAHQLDDLRDTLTPEQEDNCDQRVATYDTTEALPANVDWVKSPLSKRYTAPPKTIGALSAAGKLVELES